MLQLSASASNTDSLRKALRNLELSASTKNDTAQICATLLALANAYETAGNYPLSEVYARRLLVIANQSKNPVYIARALNGLANIYTAKGKIKEAHALQQKAHALYSKYHSPQEKGVSLFNLGVDAYALGEYEEAHQYFTAAIAQFNLAKDKAMTCETYRQMAEMYIELKQTNKAYNYTSKYQQLCLDNSPKSKGTFYQLTAQLQEQQGNFDTALYNYKRAIAEFNQCDDPFLVDWANYNLCHNLLQMNRYDEVIKRVTALLPSFPNMHASVSVCFYPLLGIAWSQRKNANFLLAEQHFKQGLALAKSYNLSTEVQYIYEQLAKMFKLKKDYAQALYYYDLEHQLKDSLLGLANEQHLNELEVRFQTREKTQQIKLLNKEKTIAQLKNKKQLQERNYLFAGLFLLLIALGTAGIAYVKTKKYNKILAQEEQRKELLLQEVHHRTNNSLQLISALLTMQSYQLDDPKAKLFLKESESRIHSMSALHELLHSNNNAAGMVVDIATYMENVINFHQNLSTPTITISSNISTATFSASIALPIALITNELITNAIKYAFDESCQDGRIHVSLQMLDHARDWLLTVSDNGKGMPSNAYTKGTGNIGSRLIRILCEQIDAVLKVEHTGGSNVLVSFKSKD